MADDGANIVNFLHVILQHMHIIKNTFKSKWQTAENNQDFSVLTL